MNDIHYIDDQELLLMHILSKQDDENGNLSARNFGILGMWKLMQIEEKKHEEVTQVQYDKNLLMWKLNPKFDSNSSINFTFKQKMLKLKDNIDYHDDSINIYYKLERISYENMKDILKDSKIFYNFSLTIQDFTINSAQVSDFVLSKECQYEDDNNNRNLNPKFPLFDDIFNGNADATNYKFIYSLRIANEFEEIDLKIEEFHDMKAKLAQLTLKQTSQDEVILHLLSSNDNIVYLATKSAESCKQVLNFYQFFRLNWFKEISSFFDGNKSICESQLLARLWDAMSKLVDARKTDFKITSLDNIEDENKQQLLQWSLYSPNFETYITFKKIDKSLLLHEFFMLSINDKGTVCKINIKVSDIQFEIDKSDLIIIEEMTNKCKANVGSRSIKDVQLNINSNASFKVKSQLLYFNDINNISVQRVEIDERYHPNTQFFRFEQRYQNIESNKIESCILLLNQKTCETYIIDDQNFTCSSLISNNNENCNDDKWRFEKMRKLCSLQAFIPTALTIWLSLSSNDISTNAFRFVDKHSIFDISRQDDNADSVFDWLFDECAELDKDLIDSSSADNSSVLKHLKIVFHFRRTECYDISKLMLLRYEVYDKEKESNLLASSVLNGMKLIDLSESQSLDIPIGFGCKRRQGIDENMRIVKDVEDKMNLMSKTANKLTFDIEYKEPLGINHRKYMTSGTMISSNLIVDKKQDYYYLNLNYQSLDGKQSDFHEAKQILKFGFDLSTNSIIYLVNMYDSRNGNCELKRVDDDFGYIERIELLLLNDDQDATRFRKKFLSNEQLEYLLFDMKEFELIKTDNELIFEKIIDINDNATDKTQLEMFKSLCLLVSSKTNQISFVKTLKFDCLDKNDTCKSWSHVEIGIQLIGFSYVSKTNTNTNTKDNQEVLRQKTNTLLLNFKLTEMGCHNSFNWLKKSLSFVNCLRDASFDSDLIKNKKQSFELEYETEENINRYLTRQRVEKLEKDFEEKLTLFGEKNSLLSKIQVSKIELSNSDNSYNKFKILVDLLERPMSLQYFTKKSQTDGNDKSELIMSAKSPLECSIKCDSGIDRCNAFTYCSDSENGSRYCKLHSKLIVSTESGNYFETQDNSSKNCDFYYLKPNEIVWPEVKQFIDTVEQSVLLMKDDFKLNEEDIRLDGISKNIRQIFWLPINFRLTQTNDIFETSHNLNIDDKDAIFTVYEVGKYIDCMFISDKFSSKSLLANSLPQCFQFCSQVSARQCKLLSYCFETKKCTVIDNISRLHEASYDNKSVVVEEGVASSYESIDFDADDIDAEFGLRQDNGIDKCSVFSRDILDESFNFVGNIDSNESQQKLNLWADQIDVETSNLFACGLKCELNLNCLAFKYCGGGGEGEDVIFAKNRTRKQGKCISQTKHFSRAEINNKTNCKYYNKRQEFNLKQIEAKQFDELKLKELTKFSLFDTKKSNKKFGDNNLFDCANTCSTNQNCLAFQFCLIDNSMDDKFSSNCKLLVSNQVSEDRKDNFELINSFIEQSNFCSIYIQQFDDDIHNNDDKNNNNNKIIPMNENSHLRYSIFVSLFATTGVIIGILIVFIFIKKKE